MPNVKINVASSGDNTVAITKTSGQICRIHGGVLQAQGAVTITLRAGLGADTAGMDFTGPMGNDTTTGFPLPYNKDGWFEVPAGKELNVSLSAAVRVGGWLNYSLTPA